MSYVAAAFMLLSVGGWQEVTSLPQTGLATYYAPGVMNQVFFNRQVESCRDCVGYVAMPHRGDLFRKVWLRYKGQAYGPFMVVDCAGAQDLAAFVSHGHLIELSYEWAVMLDINGPVSVTVLDHPPAAWPREEKYHQLH